MNINIRFQFFILLFLSIYSTLYSRELDGYIIARGGEKVFGAIRVTSINYPSGAVTINNINYLPLYVSVFFKENGSKRFKEYYAEDIDGFSFVYGDQKIFFFSIALPIKEWNQFKYKKKFLRLLINGHLILFDSKNLIMYGNTYTEVTDYYISDSNNNVSNVADNEYAAFEDYLIKSLMIEREFLNNQHYKLVSRNIKHIVLRYNQWKTSTEGK